MTNIFEDFNHYFEIIPANSKRDIKKAQRLRYQVYCVEHSFEDASHYPEGLEIDEYDGCSVHSLIKHRSSNEVIATVRLVLTDPTFPSAKFPIEEHCHLLISSHNTRQSLRRESLAEISRLAVSKEFRRRIGERETVHGITENTPKYGDEGQRRLFPHITMGLFKAIVKMSAEHGITHWCAVMEPTLLRILARFGIQFDPVGPLVQYHGWRQPCVAATDRVLAGIYHQCPEVWEFITDAGKLCRA